MRGGIAMDVITEKDNSMYSLLTEDSKKTVDRFISFLFASQEPQLNDETRKVLDDCMQGKNLVGPFDNTDDLMRALNAES